jgi:hypothetical protein
MLRCIIAALCCLGGLPQCGWGDPFQPIVELPNSYVPGQPVTFDVRLPAITNLGAYNIDLVLESNAGDAGIDFYFDVAATAPASTGYIFPSTANFFDATTVDSSMRHRITLTDFAAFGVDVARTNDRVATVVFSTTPEFNGALRVFVDTSLLILDTPNVVPTPVLGFDAIRNAISSAASIELLPVPEPSSPLIGTTALLVLLIRKRLPRG